MRVTRTFEPQADQVVEARRFVTGAIGDQDVDRAELALLVSELATNAVLHARSDFSVTVLVESDRVRVEVFDRNTRLPALAVVPADAYSGRGLMLVQALAAAWGVDAVGDGKTIWFEVGRRSADGPGRARLSGATD